MYSKRCTIYCGDIDTVLWSWKKKIKTSVSQNMCSVLWRAILFVQITFFVNWISLSPVAPLSNHGNDKDTNSSSTSQSVTLFWAMPVVPRWVILQQCWNELLDLIVTAYLMFNCISPILLFFCCSFLHNQTTEFGAAWSYHYFHSSMSLFLWK